ncbi:BPSL1445 family SYLF domain-containing lipoprotein [Azohydromonas caseinilytica]|uniref:Twin-arginine translocation pathway signal n=1 Tax=Azohydromonas caseinilytica TaxID=2728836 RepID=A0A848F6R3_9BURK|nr:YSC84-related protein [Azohydromonas caseinilytica]NML13960.1 twin-arginine translocation pathway signal [Azohydromonas caseinilytica]
MNRSPSPLLLSGANPARRGLLGALAAAPLLLASGCAVTRGGDDKSPETRRREIDTAADATLARLHDQVRGSRELTAKARGLLIFPRILAAGLVVGGEYGEGVLRTGGRNEGYYRAASGSFGFQAGAQSKAVVIAFLTQEALDKFRNSNGWTAGADASVAVAKVGANGEVDTNSIRSDVAAFAMTNVGLMYNLTIEGTKIARINDL